jgi:hypothetical protein
MQTPNMQYIAALPCDLIRKIFEEYKNGIRRRKFMRLRVKPFEPSFIRIRNIWKEEAYEMSGWHENCVKYISHTGNPVCAMSVTMEEGATIFNVFTRTLNRFRLIYNGVEQVQISIWYVVNVPGLCDGNDECDYSDTSIQTKEDVQVILRDMYEQASTYNDMLDVCKIIHEVINTHPALKDVVPETFRYVYK